MESKRRLTAIAILALTAAMVLPLAGPARAAEIGTVTNAVTDGSGRLIQLNYELDGELSGVGATNLIGSTLVLSTLQGRAGAPGSGDANRFWTLDGAPEPTETEALRSLGDKDLTTALQDCASTSQHDVLFDQTIIPGPGPEIFIFHGGLNDPFVVLDAAGQPALTIPNAPGNAISVAASTQFKAWYLQDNVNYAVVGTFPHFDTQSNIVALDLSESDVAAIGGLRFAGGGCDYVYEILGVQPEISPSAVFGASDEAIAAAGTLALASIWVDVDGDGDLDIVSEAGDLVWQENDGLDPRGWQLRTIDTAVGSDNALESGDVDGDGDIDLIATVSSPAGIYWYENDGASPPSWTKRTVSTVEGNPWVTVPTDVDGDGDLDLVVSDTSNGVPFSLAWHENDGATPPAWTRRTLASGGHHSLTTADFDRDGDIDILAASASCSADMELYESDGGSPPTFTPRVVGALTDIGIYSAAGDLDGDGDIDFVVSGDDCSGLGEGLTWFENDGAATPSFTASELSVGSYRRVMLDDVNLDGDLDIVTAGGAIGGAANYFENDGASSPGWALRSIPGLAGELSYWSDTGDFDRDGDVDLLTATASSGNVYVTENRTIHRSALFVQNIERVITGTADRAIGLFATDVDGDGDLDALSASIDDNTVAWYENDGRAFPGWTRRTISDTVVGASSVYAADVDGDGDMDAVSTGFNDDSVSWHENGAGSITLDVVNSDFELIYKAGSTTVTAPTFPAGQFAFGPSPLGMTGSFTATFSDGSTGSLFDLPGWQWSTTFGITQVDPAYNETRGNVLLINGASFGGGTAGGTATQTLTESLEQDTLYTLTADFGWRSDNAVATAPPVLELYAGGTLLTPIASSSPALVQGEWVTYSRSYRVSDAGISGALEIEIGLGPNTNGQQLNIDRVVLNKRDATAPPSWTKRVIDGAALKARNAIAADVDRDGDVDVLAASEDDDTIAWYENDGASPPSWTKRIVSNTADGAISVVAADVDGDGDLDAISTSQLDDTVAWYENDGASPPSWTKRVISNTADGAFGLFAADVDGDGDIDALSASRDDNTIAWYENDGASPPAWSERVISSTVSGAISVFAVDMDADGDLDVLSAANTGNTIAWHENDGGSPPAWTERIIDTGAILARTVFAADVDGDGDLDPLSASDGDDTIAWYRNLGGQFVNSAISCSLFGLAVEGQEVPLFSTSVRVNARPGDSPGRVASFNVILGQDAVFGRGDNPEELSKVLDTLLLYRDDGSGEFEPDRDVLVQSYDVASIPANSGTYRIEFPVDEPNTIVAAPATFILTGRVSPTATSSGYTSIGSYIARKMAVNDANATFLAPLTSEQYAPGSDACGGARTLFSRYNVDDTSDAVDANPGNGVCATAGGTCTLRAAIMEANAVAGGGFIDLPAGTFTLSVAGSDDNTLSGDLDVTEYLELRGSGAGTTIIEGAGVDRVFHAVSGQLLLFDLTITGGSTTGSGGGILAAAGATVELDGVVVSGNSATGDGGGVAVAAGGTFELVDSRIVGNSATGDGGGIHAAEDMDCIRSEISGNDGDNGGGIWATGAGVLVTLDTCTVSGNSSATFNGGGVGGDNSGAGYSLSSTTIAANSGYGITAFAATSYNSVVADNTPWDCSQRLDSTGYTLMEDGGGGVDSCAGNVGGAPGDLFGDPLLGPLGDYGGPTLTHRPLLGSPLIDAGSCLAPIDQTGQARPIDEPFTPDADDGCDVGAYEVRLGESLPIIEVPIRWCGVNGAPSIDDPSLVGEATANDVMRRRHEVASDELYEPLAGIVFRSGGNFIIEDYPILSDTDTATGMPGDVVLDLEDGDFGEFQDLMNACRSAWEALDPDIQGITAVQINRFIDPAGDPIEVLGAGGRAQFGDAAGQATASQVMLIDSFYRLGTNPEDSNERLFGHEAGHALSLLHGNGVDDDADTLLDNDDDRAAGLPRFDGSNLLQYRNGEELTLAQAQQMRAHILLTIPDGELQPFSDTIADNTEIDQEIKSILQFGYDELTELELKSLLQWELKSLLQFELKSLLQWELKSFLEWELKSLLQFELKSLLQWEQASVVQYGMDYSGTTATDESTFNISLGALPWFAPIRPDTRHYLYLDLDNDDSTGGYPVDFANPTDPGFNFPGQNNLDGEPLVAEERGVDLIIQVTMEVECPGQECDTFTMSEVFAFNDGLQQYELVFTEPNPDNVANALSLYVENGGQPLEYDDVPLGFSFRPVVPNQILFDAGWGFSAGPNGPVPNPIGVEVFTEIDCQGPLFNDDPTVPAADCQCLDCADCPDYPGCATEGTPKQLSGTRIVADRDRGLLTFEPPVLPFATASPLLAEEGQSITVYVFDLPTDVVGDVEVTLDGIQLGTVPTSAIDASGEVSLTVALPFGKLGDQRLSTGIVGRAPRATTEIVITESLLEPDNDGDGIPDATDPDDDNDGVSDVDEAANGTDPFNGFECGDSDLDSCDDCVYGSFAPADDGRDFDLDGLCNEGDLDDDGDGVDDTIDGEPLNPNACGDTDLDECDDCAVISNMPSPNNDGPDADGDGICDLTDTNAVPIALCTDVQVAANGQCEAAASVDDGSNDPEGLVQSIVEAPGGPYGLGETTVTLTITDTSGEFAECTGTVTVVDTTNPTIATCAADRTLIAGEGDGTVALDDLTAEVSASDACGILEVTQQPVAGTALAAGTHDVTLSATDVGGNSVDCVATITVLDRVLSTDNKVKVRFDKHLDGAECNDAEDDEAPPQLDEPHCFTRLDLDGDLQLRDAAMLPIDVRGPGSTSVDARLVVSLSGEVIADQALSLEVKNASDEKWEFKRPGGAAKQGAKKLKLDWKETASYDSHDFNGLGNDVPRIVTQFIGYDETDTKLTFKDVPRPFQVTFDDPVGGTFAIDVLDNQGNATTTPAGDYDLKDKKNDLTLVLPFRLTPETTVSFSSDGGQSVTDIPVDTEFNYQPAGAKYKLDLDETGLSTALCLDETTPVNSLTTPELEVQLFIGNGTSEVVGIVLVGPGGWSRVDERQWKLQP